MQPDPAVYLLRARQELKAILANSDTIEASARMTIDRIGELLAQLSLRGIELPIMARRIAPRQLDLMRETISLMSQHGVGIPAAASQLVVAERMTKEPGEGDIRLFDAMAETQALCLRLIVAAGNKSEDFNQNLQKLFRTAGNLEAFIREDYKERLTDKKHELDQLDQAANMSQPVPPTNAELETFLRQQFPQSSQIKVWNIHQQRGINTKDIIFFSVSGPPDWPNTVVMRRLRQFNVNVQVSMPYEFNVLTTLRALGIKVPKVLLLETGGALGHPFLIMEKLAGASKGAEQVGAGGQKIATQMAQHLAAIHQLDVTLVGREELTLQPDQRVLAHIDYFYKLWQANHVEPSALIEGAFFWVRNRASRLSDYAVLVHGDYDLRNLLVEGDQITAVLDWERSHIGHPAEDLAYCRLDVEKLMAWNTFLDVYQAAGGKRVSEHDLKFFNVWGYISRLVSIARAHSGFARGEHKDFLLGSAGYIEYLKILSGLNELLAQESV